jgi:DnaJ-class molecular chaperone
MDRRERDHRPWWTEFNPKTMVATIEDCNTSTGVLDVKMVWEVCGTCDGKGTHVNPSIDSHGLSREDFDEDPDFAEDYFNGVHDVTCYECNGRTTVAVPSPDNHPGVLKVIDDILQDRAEYAAECAAERRMGA